MCVAKLELGVGFKPVSTLHMRLTRFKCDITVARQRRHRAFVTEASRHLSLRLKVGHAMFPVVGSKLQVMHATLSSRPNDKLRYRGSQPADIHLLEQSR